MKKYRWSQRDSVMCVCMNCNALCAHVKRLCMFPFMVMFCGVVEPRVLYVPSSHELFFC